MFRPRLFSARSLLQRHHTHGKTHKAACNSERVPRRCLVTTSNSSKHQNRISGAPIKPGCLAISAASCQSEIIQIGDKSKVPFHHQVTRNFWGLFSRSNPLTETFTKDQGNKLESQYINYANIEPMHIKEASTDFQSKYQSDLKSLENKLQNEDMSCKDFMVELERISRPLTNLKNVITVLSCVNKEPALYAALHEANDAIDFAHEYSSIFRDFLMKKVDESDVQGDEESKRALENLLRQYRLNGSTSNDEGIQQQVRMVQEQLSATQSKFLTISSLTLEEHGQLPSPKELVQMMYQIVALQQHLSKLLGYASFAEYSLDLHNAMANSTTEIEALYDLFEQVGAVEKFGSDDFQSKYLDLLSENNEQKTVFELESALQSLFDLCRDIFGVNVKEQEENVNGWHRDVRLFHIFEDGKERIASFYLDPYRRQHKDLGCFVAPLQYKNNDSIPIVALSMDMRAPMWDDAPVELELKNVVNLYHEFGHLLEHALADVRLGAFSGAQMKEEDSSETMSQFMEYWLFEGRGLKKLTNVSEGSTNVISDEVFDKLLAQRRFTKATELLHRLFLGQLELNLSSSFDPHGDQSIISVQRDSAARYCPHHMPPKGNIDPLIQIFQSNADGKCTMQHRYLWSEVLSADAFSAFMNDAGALKECDELKVVGGALRQEMLTAGGSRSTSDAFRSFRGRDADASALVRGYGLLKDQK